MKRYDDIDVTNITTLCSFVYLHQKNEYYNNIYFKISILILISTFDDITPNATRQFHSCKSASMQSPFIQAFYIHIAFRSTLFSFEAMSQQKLMSISCIEYSGVLSG